MSLAPDGAEGRPRLDAVIVTYGPDWRFPSVLAAAVAGADRVLVWDNSDRPDARAFVRSTIDTVRSHVPAVSIEFEPAPENQGLSIAFAYALRWAATGRSDLLLLLDQDSLLRPGCVERLRGEFTRLRHRMPVGALAARNVESVQVPFSPKEALGRLFAAHQEGEYLRGRRYRDASAEEAWATSNSGLALVVEAATAVGGFDVQLFLDAIDYDLLSRLRGGGFRILRIPSAVIDHSQGVATAVGLGPVDLKVRRYSPQRSFHLVRDSLLAARKIRPRERWFAAGVVLWMAIGTVGALLLLAPRRDRARAIVRGMVAGLSEPLARLLVGGNPPWPGPTSRAELSERARALPPGGAAPGTRTPPNRKGRR